MKKLLLLSLAAMLFPMVMTAQSLRTTTLTGVLQREGVMSTFNNSFKAPARAELGPNQMILGHYDTDEVAVDGLGITGLPGVLPIATELTPGELLAFRGGKIVAFRVGLAASTPVTRVFAAPTTAEGLGEFTEWTCNVDAQGWNVIPVDPPYEISDDEGTGLFIGFDYKQTSSNYPISAVEVGTISPSYVYLTSGGQTDWFDVGLDDYGNLSIQCIVESDHFPEYALRMERLTASSMYIKAGDELNYTVTLKNGGIGTIEPGALVLDVMVDDVKVGELTNDQAIANQFVEMAGVVATESLENGAHKISVVPASLNGEAIENPVTLSYDFFIMSNMFPRQKHLLEQFTSNSCTYCPLGTSLIEVLQSKRDDIARVAIHGNMNSVDPTNTAQCDSIFSYEGCDGWPYGSFDRMPGWSDDATIANGLGYNASYHDQLADMLGEFYDHITATMPTFATININNEVDLKTREAKVTISGDVTADFDEMMGSDAKLTVYLTEDSIVYRQYNNGRWTSKYRHDGVLRQALGTVKGVALNKDGETYSNTFELTIPEAWNIEKLNVIAFISRPLTNGAKKQYTDMYVNNTEMTRIPTIKAQVMPDSVNTVVITAVGKGEVILYVDGQEVESPYTIERGEEDVTVIVVATSQDSDKVMNTVNTEVVIPAKVSQGVDEQLAGKTVSRVRYFNMMGQEMTSPSGATIVITTYTDGTTTAAKVMK